MIWLGMSIPTLPGTSRRPRGRHPGAENIEREREKDRLSVPGISPVKPAKKPAVNPAPKPKLPKIPARKSR